MLSAEAAAGENLSGSVAGGVVGSIGEQSIARSQVLRNQGAERVFRGAPQFWQVTNRAQLGNVKVWRGGFNGDVFPEGATEDKRTWLQPGDKMVLPIEAGLHFMGNLFDPRCPEAREVIERCGGFLLEGKKETPMRDSPRIIGGPIGLPDFVVEPIDGRMRRVGEPVAVYELYDKATRKFWKLPTSRYLEDKQLVAEEKALLEQRLAEYTIDDGALYDSKGRLLPPASGICDCSAIAHVRGVVGCEHSSENGRAVILGKREPEPDDHDDAEEIEEEPTDEAPEVAGPGRTRRRGR